MVKDIESLLAEYLAAYLSSFYEHYIESTHSTIDINGRKTEDDTGSIILRLGINQENQQFYISNIFIPKEDRRKGIGLGLISFIYQIAKAVNYDLVLVMLTDSFRERMIRRGALETNSYDNLFIVDSTVLT